MRFVALADTHLFESEGFAVPDGDVLIHAGDMLREGTLDELSRAAAWLKSLPHAHKILVPGNHDVCFETDRGAAQALVGPSVTVLIDDETEVGGLRVYGTPWTPDYPQWGFHLPRGPAAARVFAAIPDGLDILVSHVPPRGYGDRWDEGHIGFDELRAAAARAKPRVHLWGHVHTDGGASVVHGTTYLNVTVWECDRPCTVFDVAPGGGPIQLVQVPPPGDP